MLKDSSRPVVIIAMNAFRPGGSQTYAFALARMLHDQGIQPVLVAKPGPWFKEASFSAPCVRVMWREGTASENSRWMKRLLLRVLEAASARHLAIKVKNAALIISSQPGPTAFFSKYSLRNWPEAKRMALVHGTTPVEWPFRDHVETVSQLSGLLAATSETSAFLKDQAPNMTVDELGNIFRAEMYWGQNASEIVDTYDRQGPAVFLGTLTPNKTAPLAALFSAVASLGVSLVVVGGGPQEDELRRSVQERGLESQVTFVGAVTDPRPWIVRASVVVTAGRGAIESMAAGRPTVVATSDGTHGLATLSGIEELQRYNFTGRTPSSMQATPDEMSLALTEALALNETERLTLSKKNERSRDHRTHRECNY
ncbi:glycosyltransferase [Arthrobacter pascens]|uniref:glycosyltransferase n=2 Tax=Arthrobacter pascens TaxID=1677 RepID=UPI00196B0034|nr:glycosyltransferase [Arthrobacter pascens]MBN3499300.1 glycosyltransferase family 4 protein [Arthrobacter pascens]